MKKRKLLTDKQLVTKAGGVLAVATLLGFASTNAVYNWLGSTARKMPTHWRTILEQHLTNNPRD
jgi:hypothetical protein